MRILFAISCLVLALNSSSLEALQPIAVWGEDAPPYAVAHDLEEYEAECWGGVVCAYQVVIPTLTIYPAEGTDTGMAVLILPGGGYETVAVYHEGYEIATEFARRGILAAVLKYRLPSPLTASKPERVPMVDVRQGLKRVRELHGHEVKKVGVVGFSAGGHLAASVSVHRSKNPMENPDFSILVYGVSRMTQENREWLEKTLYHRAMSAQETGFQTLHEQVDTDTPPAFLVHAFDDDVCHYSESSLYAEALQRNGVEAEMHLYARGGHGFGRGRDAVGTGQWIGLASQWLGRMAIQGETREP